MGMGTNEVTHGGSTAVRARAHNSRLGALVATGAALFLTTSLAIDCTCVDKQNV